MRCPRWLPLAGASVLWLNKPFVGKYCIMKKFQNSFTTLVNMKKFFAIAAVSTLFFACSEDEQQKLPDLPKISAPTGVAGEYVGRIPPQDAKARQVHLSLDTTGVAIVNESILTDTVETKVDTLTYVVEGEFLSVKFKEKTWNFKKNGDFGYLFLNPQGEPFVDEAGNNFALLRILNKPKVKNED